MMIRLHAVNGYSNDIMGGAELLRIDCTQRPNLDLRFEGVDDNNDQKKSSTKRNTPTIISLGKNSYTMIADPTLPRNAVDVVVELSDDTDTETDEMGVGDTMRLLDDPMSFSFEQKRTTHSSDRKLRLRIHKYIAGFVAINKVTVNTPNAIIKEGDILSLQSMSYSYDYVVLIVPASEAITDASTLKSLSVLSATEEISDTSDDQNDAKENQAKAQVTDSPYIEIVDQQQKLIQQMVDDEYTCAICLEYQVQSTAIVPCGHSFCNTCILDGKTKKLKHKLCSVCNSKIITTVPNRTIDSCLNLLVQFQTQQPESESLCATILPAEDLEHYKERSDQQMTERMKDKKPDRPHRGKRLRWSDIPMAPIAPIAMVGNPVTVGGVVQQLNGDNDNNDINNDDEPLPFDAQNIMNAAIFLENTFVFQTPLTGGNRAQRPTPPVPQQQHIHARRTRNTLRPVQPQPLQQGTGGTGFGRTPTDAIEID